jgi:hypothetical protein
LAFKNPPRQFTERTYPNRNQFVHDQALHAHGA